MCHEALVDNTELSWAIKGLKELLPNAIDVVW